MRTIERGQTQDPEAAPRGGVAGSRRSVYETVAGIDRIIAAQTRLRTIQAPIMKLLFAVAEGKVVSTHVRLLLDTAATELSEEAMEPQIQSRGHLSAQARILDHEMLDAKDVAVVLGSRARNVREYASALRKQGGVLALREANRYRYPAFQFDRSHARVHAIVEDVNRLLDAKGDPWGVADWWYSRDPHFGIVPAESVGDTTNDETLRKIAAFALDVVN